MNRLAMSHVSISSVISAPIFWIAISAGVSLLLEWLWEFLFALSIHHAHAVCIEIAARSMNHAAHDDVIQVGILLAIRDCCADYEIDFVAS